MQGAAHMDSLDKDGAIRNRLVRIYGRVQGVGFREACVRRARARGVTGWVRNRVDGSVEVMLQGSPEQLADMCNWLRDGISAAVVDKIEVMEMQPPLPRFDHFDRLPTL